MGLQRPRVAVKDFHKDVQLHNVVHNLFNLFLQLLVFPIRKEPQVIKFLQDFLGLAAALALESLCQGPQQCSLCSPCNRRCGRRNPRSRHSLPRRLPLRRSQQVLEAYPADPIWTIRRQYSTNLLTS